MARARQGQGQPPPADLPPAGNEYRQGEILKATLRPGKYPGETIAEPTQGKRTPPFVVVEKIFPGYFPGEEVDIKIVFSSPRKAAGEVVGPEEVVKEIQKQLEEGLKKSEKYWKDNLLTAPLHIKSDKIQKRERRDGPPRFEYEFPDTMNGNMPLKVFIPNLPADWDPRKAPTIEVQVESIQIHNRDKRLFGEAWATAPEFKPTPELQANRDAKKLLAEIRDPKDGLGFEYDLATAKAITVKRENRWVILDIGDDLYHAEARLDVPKDWSPDKLTEDPVVFKATDAKSEGSKVLIRVRIEGVEPGPREEEASEREPKKADVKENKVEVKAAKGFGKILGDALKGMATPEINTALEPLLTELDSPELADLKGLKRRLAVVDEILEQISFIRTHLITQAATDDAALLILPRLLEQKKKVEAEQGRVGKAIKDAQEVWGDTIKEMKRDMDVPRTARLDRLNKLRPMVEAAAELRAYKRINGDPDVGLGILEIEDVDEVKRLQAENAIVLQQQEDFIYDGTWPEKPGDPDYRLSEMAEDFLVAELLVQPFADRMSELEGVASGAPAPVKPVPPPPDLGLPGPLKVPVSASPAPEAVPTTVEAVVELTAEDMVIWLKREGFGLGEFVGFTKASRSRLERLFGTAGSLPELLRIRSISVTDEEVEFDLSDGTTGVISIEQLYRMEQEMAGLTLKLEQAGIVTNSLVEFTDDAAVGLLRPQMEHWIEGHPGKGLPKKVRIEGVDTVSGEVGLDVEGAPEVGVIRVPLEAMAALVTDKKLTVLKGVGPFAAAGGEARLEPLRSGTLAERPLSAEVSAGQIWKYTGPPSNRLNPGGNFKVEKVDDEKGLIRVITAKEEAAAARERRPAEKLLISRDQWRGLPKTLVNGPQPETRAGGAAGQAEEERLLREIEVGQVYAYEGSDTYPFKLNDQFNIVALNAEKKVVSFVIAREVEAAKLKKQKPQVYELQLKQWKLIKKRLVRGGPVVPPPSPRPPESPARRTQILPPQEEPEITGAFGVPRPVERAAVPPQILPPFPPLPGGNVVEASFPPKEPGYLETPNSFSDLVDLMRNRELVDLLKAEVKKRAGIFSGLLSVMSDPFVDMTKRIERIATESGAALAVNATLQERLRAASPAPTGVEHALGELEEAERAYRQTEMMALQYTTEQINALLKGKKVDSEEARNETLEVVQKMLGKLKKANDTARGVLDPGSGGSGPVRRGTRRST